MEEASRRVDIPREAELLCKCGRTAVIMVNGVLHCEAHTPPRRKITVEWDQLSLLGEPPKREKASWLE